MLDLNQFTHTEKPEYTPIPENTILWARCFPERPQQNGCNFDDVSGWYFKWPDDHLVKLKFKFQILFGKDQDTKYSNRFLFNDLCVGSITPNAVPENQMKMLNIHGRQLVNLINEKLGLDPKDKSDATVQKRMISDPSDFTADVCIKVNQYGSQDKIKNGCFIMSIYDKGYINSKGKPYVKPSESLVSSAGDEIPF